VVIPAGAGLVPASPPGPAQSVGDAVQGLVEQMYSRLISGTVNGIRPGSSGGSSPDLVGSGGAGLVSRRSAVVTAQIARAAMTGVRCRMTGPCRRTWAWS